MKKLFYCFQLAVIILFSFPNANAQKKNASRFIEPNVSVSYDSSLYRLSKEYGSFHTRQGFDFIRKNDPVRQRRIHIEANISNSEPRKTLQDSNVLKSLEQIKSERLKSPGRIPVLEETIKDVHGFSCFGFVMYDSSQKMHLTMISGHRLFKGGMSDFRYYSNSNDLKADYDLLTDLLSGWRSYTSEEIEREEADMKKKYVVSVDSVALTSDEQRYRNTFVAIVRVKPVSPNGILGAMVKNTLYRPKDNGVRITFSDRDPGQIAHKGQLYLLNSFGKTVMFPFTISYTNKVAE